MMEKVSSVYCGGHERLHHGSHTRHRVSDLYCGKVGIGRQSHIQVLFRCAAESIVPGTTNNDQRMELNIRKTSYVYLALCYTLTNI